MIEQLSKKPLAVSGARLPSLASTSTKQNPALRSLAHLQQVEKKADDGIGATLKKGVIAALLGLTLIGATVTPAHADSVQLPQTAAHSLSLDSAQLQQARGGEYAKLLGTVSTPTTKTASVDAATQQAFSTFEASVTRILQRDAGSLAAGLRPLQSGEAPTAAQQKELQRAVTDLFAHLPVGAFAPGVQSALEGALGAAGHSTDLSTTRLKDLGKIGGKAAGDLVKQFQKDHPTAFWALAGTGAAAALAVGYTQGTDALEKLGIKPEFKTGLFDDVKLAVGLRAGPRFSDPRLSLGLDGKHTFAGGTVVKGGISAELQGKQLQSFGVSAGLSTSSGGNVDGKVSFDGRGKPFDARLSASQTFNLDDGHGVIFANATWSNGQNGTAVQSTLSAGLAAQHGRWTTSISGSHDFNSGAFSSSLATGRTFDLRHKNDLDVQVRATIDNRGSSSVGAGITLHF